MNDYIPIGQIGNYRRKEKFKNAARNVGIGIQKGFQPIGQGIAMTGVGIYRGIKRLGEIKREKGIQARTLGKGKGYYYGTKSRGIKVSQANPLGYIPPSQKQTQQIRQIGFNNPISGFGFQPLQPKPKTRTITKTKYITRYVKRKRR